MEYIEFTCGFSDVKFSIFNAFFSEYFEKGKGQKMTYKYTKTDRKTLNLKQLPENHKKAGFWKIRQNN